MSSYDMPVEYMHCFNIMDEIPESDPMEIERVQKDLYGTVDLEWHHCEEPGTSEKLPEPDVKKIMDLDSYQSYRQLVSKNNEVL